LHDVETLTKTFAYYVSHIETSHKTF